MEGVVEGELIEKTQDLIGSCWFLSFERSRVIIDLLLTRRILSSCVPSQRGSLVIVRYCSRSTYLW